MATGGYGDGCAVDLAGIDQASNAVVWHWLSLHAAEFGLRQVLPRVDPAHVQPRGAWHAIGTTLRNARLQQKQLQDVAETIRASVKEPVDVIAISELACTQARLAPEKSAGDIPAAWKPRRLSVGPG